jgi:hypothetical protein
LALSLSFDKTSDCLLVCDLQEEMADVGDESSEYRAIIVKTLLLGFGANNNNLLATQPRIAQ